MTLDPHSSHEPLHWFLPHQIQLAFSTVTDGDLLNPELRQRWLAHLNIRNPCAVTRQVHGTSIQHVTDSSPLSSTADGMVTNTPHLALGVFGADCPGLALITPDAFGLAHAGWKGTAAGIVGTLAAALSTLSSCPRSQWTAFIGPGIRGNSYEVDAPVINARSWPQESLIPHGADHAYLDLPTAIASDCRDTGISNVIYSNINTATDSRLHSYRQRGKSIVQMLVMWRDNKA